MEELDLENISPEQLEFLLEAYGGQLEGEQLKDQLQQARALRERGLTSPQGRQAGAVYVAANPLEHIGQAMQGYAGLKKERAAEEALGTLNKSQGDRVKQLGEAFFNRKPKPAMPDPFDSYSTQDY